MVSNKIKKGLLIVFCLVLIIPVALHFFPFLVGADNSFVILGGSMEPTFHKGDVIFTQKTTVSEIEVGDIVSVNFDSGVYTHRVFEKTNANDQVTILLKGDANEDPDLQVVTSENIVGKVMFSIPLVGYLGSLMRTIYGYIFLIVLPAIVLIIFETKNIFQELKKEKPR